MDTVDLKLAQDCESLAVAASEGVGWLKNAAEQKSLGQLTEGSILRLNSTCGGSSTKILRNTGGLFVPYWVDGTIRDTKIPLFCEFRGFGGPGCERAFQL